MAPDGHWLAPAGRCTAASLKSWGRFADTPPSPSLCIASTVIHPALPVNETTRLGTLRSLNILDTSAEERFDRLTRLAKRLFGVPIALISLVDADRQWFKSCQGLSATETPRDVSF
jgi:hypothetical protein